MELIENWPFRDAGFAQETWQKLEKVLSFSSELQNFMCPVIKMERTQPHEIKVTKRLPKVYKSFLEAFEENGAALTDKEERKFFLIHSLLINLSEAMEHFGSIFRSIEMADFLVYIDEEGKENVVLNPTSLNFSISPSLSDKSLLTLAQRFGLSFARFVFPSCKSTPDSQLFPKITSRSIESSVTSSSVLPCVPSAQILTIIEDFVQIANAFRAVRARCSKAYCFFVAPNECADFGIERKEICTFISEKDTTPSDVLAFIRGLIFTKSPPTDLIDDIFCESPLTMISLLKAAPMRISGGIYSCRSPSFSASTNPLLTTPASIPENELSDADSRLSFEDFVHVPVLDDDNPSSELASKNEKKLDSSASLASTQELAPRSLVYEKILRILTLVLDSQHFDQYNSFLSFLSTILDNEELKTFLIDGKPIFHPQDDVKVSVEHLHTYLIAAHSKMNSFRQMYIKKRFSENLNVALQNMGFLEESIRLSKPNISGPELSNPSSTSSSPFTHRRNLFPHDQSSSIYTSSSIRSSSSSSRASDERSQQEEVEHKEGEDDQTEEDGSFSLLSSSSIELSSTDKKEKVKVVDVCPSCHRQISSSSSMQKDNAQSQLDIQLQFQLEKIEPALVSGEDNEGTPDASIVSFITSQPDLKMAIETLEKKNEELNQLVKLREEEVSFLTEKCTTLERENEDLALTLNKLREDMSRAQEIIRELKQRISIQQAKIEELQLSLDENEELLVNRQEKIMSLQSELIDLQAVITQQEKEEAKKTTLLDDLQRQIKFIEKKNVETEAKIFDQIRSSAVVFVRDEKGQNDTFSVLLNSPDFSAESLRRKISSQVFGVERDYSKIMLSRELRDSFDKRPVAEVLTPCSVYFAYYSLK